LSFRDSHAQVTINRRSLLGSLRLSYAAQPNVEPCESSSLESPSISTDDTSSLRSRSLSYVLAAISKNKLFACLILIGVALRLIEYLHNRSMWWDESMLALNILHRTARQLWQPLDYNQGAPIGFLLLERLAVNMFGQGELALRLVPLISGILSVFLFYRVALRFLTPLGARISMALFAISDTLIYYSAEVKQYSTDVAVALLVILASQEAF
jgi:predicted membrane-bound mannosyltransferase